MEFELRFDEVMGGYQGINALMDKPFRSLETSVRLGDALRRLSPLFEDVAKRHDALLEQHAKRDAEGEIMYKDEQKTQIDPLDTLQDALAEFFGYSIQVSLPKLAPDGLELTEGALQLSDVIAISFLFAPETQETTVERDHVIGVLQAFDWLMQEAFVSGEAMVRMAKARRVLVEVARQIFEERKQIIMDLVPKDEAGEVVYLDKATQEIAITPEMEQAVGKYIHGVVTVAVPVLTPADFALAGGGALSPRRLFGLGPILTMDAGE